jgi:hypothetical protein
MSVRATTRTPRIVATPLTEEFWQRFVKDAHVLVAEGFSRLSPAARVDNHEERISEKIVEEILRWYDASGRPDWTRCYSILAEVREPGGVRTDKARRRIDIHIESNEGRGRPPRFLFEAKRFYRDDSVAEYVGPEGLRAFLDGSYARDAPAAGMLGYVQEASDADISTKVERKLNRDRALHGLALKGAIWTTQQLDVRLGWTFVSLHTREGSLGPIVLYHSFVRCCP